MIELHIVFERITLAALFGGIIGIERELKHKAAGIKTNIHVAIGAAAFAMLSNTFGPGNHNPAQMAAAVITGIGFVGAGVIIHRGVSVQGVTTAATLWANAAMAAAIGLGQSWVGAVVLGAMLAVQFLVVRLEEVIDARRRPERPLTELRVTCAPAALPSVDQICNSLGVTPLQHRTTLRGNEVLWFACVPAPLEKLRPIEAQLAAIEGVREVDVRARGVEE